MARMKTRRHVSLYSDGRDKRWWVLDKKFPKEDQTCFFSFSFWVGKSEVNTALLNIRGKDKWWIKFSIGWQRYFNKLGEESLRFWTITCVLEKESKENTPFFDSPKAQTRKRIKNKNKNKNTSTSALQTLKCFIIIGVHNTTIEYECNIFQSFRSNFPYCQGDSYRMIIAFHSLAPHFKVYN